MFRTAFISILSILFFSQNGFAQAVTYQTDYNKNLDPHSHTSCFCEIGSFPENQQIFFSLGCEIWLARQNSCNYKAIVQQDANYLTTAMPIDTHALNVGYVGHWDNSRHFIAYLGSSIIPYMQATNASVFVDNTACDAMNDPESVSAFLNTQKFSSDQSLLARGNQATSIGTWDVVLPSSDNFTAEVSSKIDHVIYPSCDNYESKPCFQGVQDFQRARCLNQQESLTTLTCCPAKIAGRSPTEPPLFKWELPQNCR